MKRHFTLLAITFSLILAFSSPTLAAGGGGHGGGGHGGGSEGSGGSGHGGHSDTGGSGQDHGASTHNQHGGTASQQGQAGHGEHGSMDHSAHMGDLIHETEVNGYQMAYHLIDMREKMKGMENMPEMAATHHLMVYIKDPQGQMVDQAKAGYLLGNPDGTEQKAMTMAMSGGFGADVVLDQPGSYTIKTKVMAGEAKLIDSFDYEMK